MNKLSFKLEIKTIPVELQEADGSTRLYELVEMNGTQRDHYSQDVHGRMKFTDDGKRGTLVRVEGLNAKLLSLTLRDTETREFVPAEKIKTWPSSVSEALAKASRDLSKLNTEDEAEIKKAKNDSAASASNGSDSQTA